MNIPTPSSSRALVAIHTHSTIPPSPSTRSILSSRSVTKEEHEEQWQPILHASNQVVLYNPRSHALSITPASGSEPLASGVVVARRQRREESSAAARMAPDLCPYCKQTLPPGFVGYGGARTGAGDSSLPHEEDAVHGGWGYLDTSDDDDESADIEAVSTDPAYHARASDYFRLLEVVNETSSAASGSRRGSISPHAYRAGYHSHDEEVDRWSSRRARSRSRGRRSKTRTPENTSHEGAFPADKMAEGYFKTFFQEEYKLGMGANGSVFLCQVSFSFRNSSSYLLNVLS